MNRYIAITLPLVLTGCALLPQNYDNNEFGLLARIETNGRLVKESCESPAAVTPRLNAMVEDVELLTTYTFYTPNNSETYQSAILIKDDIYEFRNQYTSGKATPSYCKIKSQVIVIKTQRVLESVGQKPRG